MIVEPIYYSCERNFVELLFLFIKISISLFLFVKISIPLLYYVVAYFIIKPLINICFITGQLISSKLYKEFFYPKYFLLNVMLRELDNP